LLYLGLAAIVVGIAENEIQAIASAGPGAIWDGDFDVEHLSHTWLGQLAFAYPALSLPLVTLCIVAALFGFVIDRRVKVGDAHAVFVRARDLDPDLFSMGDPRAATFPYIVEPVQGAYDATVSGLGAAAKAPPSRRGVLVVGKTNTGKTRLAFEALTHALPQWWVLRSEVAQQLPPEEAFAGRDVVPFVDDVQNYGGGALGVGGGALAGPAATVLALWNRAKEHAQRAVLVATCRQEPLDEGVVRGNLPWLFTELERVDVQLFNPDDAEGKAIQAAFKAAGAPSAAAFDGTLGSLVLGVEKKCEQYDGLKGKPAGTVLRAMKLLRLVGIEAHTERRVRMVASGVFGTAALATDDALWRRAIGDLTHADFIRVDQIASAEQRLVIRKDPTYFDQVVTDYPDPTQPGQFDHDAATLMDRLQALGDAEALVSIGTDRAIHGRLAEAQEAYNRALRLEPDDPSALDNLANVLARQREYEEAERLYRRALLLEPNDDIALINLGLLLYHIGRQEEGLRTLQRAADLRPGDPRIYQICADALVGLGRFAEAERYYRRALELDPTFAEALIGFANLLDSNNRSAAAEPLYRRALALDEANAEAHYHLAILLSGLDRDEEAEHHYRRAVELEPDVAYPHIGYGRFLARHERYPEALAAYDRALAIDPDNAQVWHNTAIALRALGRTAEAEEVERRAKELGDSGDDDAT
jgi:tetratricopeptide (TPR) repeat protein